MAAAVAAQYIDMRVIGPTPDVVAGRSQDFDRKT